jgi:hypothetical protein
MVEVTVGMVAMVMMAEMLVAMVEETLEVMVEGIVVMMEEMLEVMAEVMVEVMVVEIVVMKEGMLEVMEEEMKVMEEIHTDNQAVMTMEQLFMRRPLMELVVMEILVDLGDMEVMFIDLNSFKHQCECHQLIKLR